MKKQTDNKFVKSSFDRPHIPSTINELNEYSIVKLFTLTKEGDIHKIKEFISNNNINYLSARDNNGRNVIHSVIENMLIADEKQKCDIIDFFILNSVSVNVQDNNNITPLHLACKYQLYSVIELLLKNNANPNLVDNQHMSCLHYACQGNIVKCDEEPKVDVLSKDEYSDLVENIVHLLYHSPSGGTTSIRGLIDTAINAIEGAINVPVLKRSYTAISKKDMASVQEFIQTNNDAIYNSISLRLQNIITRIIGFVLTIYQNPTIINIDVARNKNKKTNELVEETITIKQKYLDKIGYTNLVKHIDTITTNLLQNIFKKHLYLQFNKKVIKDNLESDVQDDATTLLNSNYDYIILQDPKIKFNFNELYKDMLLLINNNVSYTIPLTINKLTNNHTIINTNYKSLTIPENQCYLINSNIIKLLITHGANPNIQDINHQTPIYYAISIVHPALVIQLKNNGAFTTNIKNTFGYNPQAYTMSLFKSHLDIMNTNNTIIDFITNFTSPHYEEITTKINKQELTSCKNMFKMALLIYIQKSYFDLLKYNNGYTYEKVNKLYNLLNKYNNTNISLEIPLTISLNSKLNTNSKIMNIEQINIINEQNKYRELQDELNQKEQNIRLELNSMRLPAERIMSSRQNKLDEELVRINEEKRNLSDKIFEIDVKINNLNTSQIKINTNIDLKVNNTTNKYLLMYNNADTPTELYNNIFTHIIAKLTKRPDYALYNETWDNYVTSDASMNKIINTQIICFIILRKMLVTSANKTDLNNLCNLFSPMLNINSTKETTISHVLQYTIFTSMYYAIVKFVTKYIMESIDKKAIITINNVRKPDNIIFINTAKIIIDRLMERITMEKYVVAEAITEYMRDKTSVTIKKKIINLFVVNDYFPIPSNSEMITQLDELLTFYFSLLDATYKQMNVMFDNYDRYVMNTKQYLDILNVV